MSDQEQYVAEWARRQLRKSRKERALYWAERAGWMMIGIGIGGQVATWLLR